MKWQGTLKIDIHGGYLLIPSESLCNSQLLGDISNSNVELIWKLIEK